MTDRRCFVCGAGAPSYLGRCHQCNKERYRFAEIVARSCFDGQLNGACFVVADELLALKREYAYDCTHCGAKSVDVSHFMKCAKAMDAWEAALKAHGVPVTSCPACDDDGGDCVVCGGPASTTKASDDLILGCPQCGRNAAGVACGEDGEWRPMYTCDHTTETAPADTKARILAGREKRRPPTFYLPATQNTPPLEDAK